MNYIEHVVSTSLQFIHKCIDFWRSYRKNRMGVVALIFLVAIVCMGILSPFAPYGPFDSIAAPLLMPHWGHPFGTDQLGRDIFSQLLYGCRTSMVIAGIATLLSGVTGILFGCFAGYFGGMVDDALMRTLDFFQVIPRFVLAVVLAALLGPSVINLIFIIGVLQWPRLARMLRSEILYLKEEQFVEAARALGIGHFTILFKEIFPNALHILIVDTSLTIGHAILLESGLAFLGLSDPRTMSLGYMINRAMIVLRLAWHPIFFPGLFIFVIVFCSNVMGDWLNDLLNPRIVGRGK